MRAISPITALAPGQRFAQPGAGDRFPSQTVTVDRLERDPFGALVVIFRAADGRDLTVYGSQVEAAVADGALTPLTPELARSA